MALFGSDWLEDYDSLEEYETHVGGPNYKDEEIDYDKPVCPAIHLEDDYDSLDDYENGIKHFKD